MTTIRTRWGNTRGQRIRMWIFFRAFGWLSPTMGAVTFREAWSGVRVRDYRVRP